MKIAKNTPQLLVLNVPTYAGCLAGLIVSLPGLIFILLPFFALGSLSYSSLKCNRIASEPTKCQVFRVSLSHYYSEQFTLDKLQNVSLQTKSVPYGNGSKNAYRVILETNRKQIPFTMYYTSKFPQKLRSEIETFVSNENKDSLKIKVKPNLLGVIFFIIMLLMALPSLLFGGLLGGFIAASSKCSCRFDRTLNLATWKTEGLFREKRQCHLNEISSVEVKPETLKCKKNNSVIYHVLYIKLHSGEVFLRYHYITPEEATKIAQLINKFMQLN
ncbi:hypothetical protein [Lyngbya sp. PCC 8106]|uniref:hypothetical protein n=1 Tax=Lyngbya sp. (strain PCC 8106) TaxID=313612 RepID=UPI0000EAA22F|nr:hypothetical protein [Lyngbya sp. PCC 8106]EAW36955.1 hypothetical protein L8106_21112 [Lyngbya sp. PCC 8106]